jgi:hypothetical protein
MKKVLFIFFFAVTLIAVFSGCATQQHTGCKATKQMGGY